MGYAVGESISEILTNIYVPHIMDPESEDPMAWKLREEIEVIKKEMNQVGHSHEDFTNFYNDGL